MTILIGLGVIVFSILVILLLIKSLLIICKPNEAWVIAGAKGKDTKNKIISSGTYLRIPFIQEALRLSLEPYNLNINIKEGLSQTKVPIDVGGNLTFKIGSDSTLLQEASSTILHMSDEEILRQVDDIVVGEFRQVLSEMEVEAIIQDREALKIKVEASINNEINKLGLEVVNTNIKSIEDSAGYIQAMGQESIAKTTEQAAAKKAEQETLGRTKVAEQQAALISKEAEYKKQQEINVAEASAEQAEVIAKSNGRKAIAESELEQTKTKALKDAALIDQDAKTKVYEETQKSELARLRAAEVVQEEIAKEKQIINAQATKEALILQGEGAKQAAILKAEGEAKGIEAINKAIAEGYQKQVDAFKGNIDAFIEAKKIENLQIVVDGQIKASENIKIDKVTILGQGENGSKKTPVGGFVNDMMYSLPIMKEYFNNTGTEIPSFLSGKPIQEDIIEVDKELGNKVTNDINKKESND